jgi:hypothetical protein
VAFQSDSPSDNEKHPRLERLRTWFGGLRRIQRVNEFYHRHRRLLLVLHMVALLAMLALVVWWLSV